MKKSNVSSGPVLKQISKKEYDSQISTYCTNSSNVQKNVCIQNKQYKEYDYKDSTKNYVLHLYPTIVEDGTVFLSFENTGKSGCLCPVDFKGSKCETYISPVCESNLTILSKRQLDRSRFDFNYNLNGGNSPENLIVDDKVGFEVSFKCQTENYQNIQEKIFNGKEFMYLEFD